jgi:hypothetical protein
MVGFMARMEYPPAGGFYLTRIPVDCDEMGAGTGDLPPDSVLVHIVPAPATVPFVPGPVEIIGTLKVGRQEGTDGQVSHVQLVLELPTSSASLSPSQRTNTNRTEEQP